MMICYRQYKGLRHLLMIYMTEILCLLDFIRLHLLKKIGMENQWDLLFLVPPHLKDSFLLVRMMILDIWETGILWGGTVFQ